MCWQCDHPDRTWLDYLGHMRDLIAWEAGHRGGQPVLGSRAAPPASAA
jgi:hypothetical protein